MKPDVERPPVYTVWEEVCGWTFDRTADIPKSQRFTFGQRIDALALDVLQLIVRAIHVREKTDLLDEINLKLEELRVLWRLVQKRGWINLRQLDFIQARLDEAGRMIGGWRKQQAEKGSGSVVGPGADRADRREARNPTAKGSAGRDAAPRRPGSDPDDGRRGAPSLPSEPIGMSRPTK